jgi:uncharacterized protein (DUF302 family)
MSNKKYGMRIVAYAAYAEALAKTRQALEAEGFGVLTEIDLRAKLKEKLNVDFKRYIILGVCNPPLAYRALKAEPEIGLLLPCNVIVYEQSVDETVVAAIDPLTMIDAVGDTAELRAVAEDARGRLSRALDSIAGQTVSTSSR